MYETTSLPQEAAGRTHALSFLDFLHCGKVCRVYGHQFCPYEDHDSHRGHWQISKRFSPVFFSVTTFGCYGYAFVFQAFLLDLVIPRVLHGPIATWL